jgi:hypothetical protein
MWQSVQTLIGTAVCPHCGKDVDWQFFPYQRKRHAPGDVDYFDIEDNRFSARLIDDDKYEIDCSFCYRYFEFNSR